MDLHSNVENCNRGKSSITFVTLTEKPNKKSFPTKPDSSKQTLETAIA
jgi:hypothetical protein